MYIPCLGFATPARRLFSAIGSPLVASFKVLKGGGFIDQAKHFSEGGGALACLKSA